MYFFNRKWLLLTFFFVVVGIPRFLSLSAHWGSDEALWLDRSANFMTAVKRGAFSETFIAYHPGVITMWVAGIRTFFVDTGIDIPNLVQARFFLGVVVWLGLGICVILLYRLFGHLEAVISLAFFAYSPFLLSQTRRVHTDALAAIFILLTMLLFLLYLKNNQHHSYLTFSGITFGLAFLSKSYSLILLIWFPVCLYFFYKHQCKISMLTVIADALYFMSCVVLTVIVLFPVFWNIFYTLLGISLFVTTGILLNTIKKDQHRFLTLLLTGIVLVFVCFNVASTVWYVFDRVGWAITTPHEIGHYFFGKVVNDPGGFFYPFVLFIKSTPLMLPLTLIACILLWANRTHCEETGDRFRMALSLVAGVILFTICLSATQKKFDRYLLAAFVMLEILSALGFVEGLKWCYKVLCSRFSTDKINAYKMPLVVISCLCIFCIQVMPVLALHPYYGTYYNLYWKTTDITKTLSVGDGSGLDIAASYLNEKPNGHRIVVKISPLVTQIMSRYLYSSIYRLDRHYGHTPDYEVVYIRDAQIGLVPQTGTLNGELESRISINGIVHVWIYRVQPRDTK